MVFAYWINGSKLLVWIICNFGTSAVHLCVNLHHEISYPKTTKKCKNTEKWPEEMFEQNVITLLMRLPSCDIDGVCYFQSLGICVVLQIITSLQSSKVILKIWKSIMLLTKDIYSEGNDVLNMVLYLPEPPTCMTIYFLFFVLSVVLAYILLHVPLLSFTFYFYI